MARSIESCVEALGRDIDDTGGSDPKVWRKFSTLIRDCGWKKRSPERVASLSQALAHAGIYTDHDLLDMTLPTSTTIWLSRRPPEVLSRIFHQERAVGYHLGKYRDVLETALPQYAPLTHKHGGNRKEQGYTLDGVRLIPDLVFQARSKEWIVCEIERGDPTRESVPQLVEYMRAVGSNGRQVVGVLITAKPRTHYWRDVTRERIGSIPKEFGPAHWLWYDVSVTLESGV